MISLIVAIAKDRVIGAKNELPWYLPADLKRFASITKGHTVIMGRKTFESILARLGEPLPERRNIIVTRSQDYKVAGCEVVHSLEDALKKVPALEEAFVIGGAELYAIALPLADKLYITEIDADIPGDTFFPEFNRGEWRITKTEPHSKDEKNQIDLTWTELEKLK